MATTPPAETPFWPPAPVDAPRAADGRVVVVVVANVVLSREAPSAAVTTRNLGVAVVEVLVVVEDVTEVSVLVASAFVVVTLVVVVVVVVVVVAVPVVELEVLTAVVSFEVVGFVDGGSVNPSHGACSAVASDVGSQRADLRDNKRRQVLFDVGSQRADLRDNKRRQVLFGLYPECHLQSGSPQYNLTVSISQPTIKKKTVW
jgi:hypothetical protein